MHFMEFSRLVSIIEELGEKHYILLLDRRINYLESFISMRTSDHPEDEMWSNVCASEIQHTMPRPTYRVISVDTICQNMHVCSGITSLVTDTRSVSEFLSKVRIFINLYLLLILENVKFTPNS